MTIDFHAHIFPDKIAEKTIHSMEKQAGIKAFYRQASTAKTAFFPLAGFTPTTRIFRKNLPISAPWALKASSYTRTIRGQPTLTIPDISES